MICIWKCENVTEFKNVIICIQRWIYTKDINFEIKENEYVAFVGHNIVVNQQ